MHTGEVGSQRQFAQGEELNPCGSALGLAIAGAFFNCGVGTIDVLPCGPRGWVASNGSDWTAGQIDMRIQFRLSSSAALKVFSSAFSDLALMRY